MDLFSNSILLVSKHLEKRISINEILEKAATIDTSIKDIPIQWVNVSYNFLYKEPYVFFDKDVCECTFSGIEKIYERKLETFSEGMYDSLRHFMIAYFTFEELVKVIDNLEPISENPQIKTRMYRIPTYINIVEGCLSNLYKAIRDLLDTTTEKDLKSQNKLQGLCTVMEKYQYEVLTQHIDVDIRNAINHGGILLSDEDISFFYMKGNIQQQKKLRYYNFDELIEKSFDSVSGIIMGFLKFFMIYPEAILGTYILMEEKADFFIKMSLARLLYSFPGTKCEFISIDKIGEEEQLNLYFFTDIVDSNEIIMFAIEVALLSRLWFPTHQQYYISFEGERMLSGWARFSSEELESCIDAESIIVVIKKALSEVRIFLPGASDEIIDMDIVKYHRFPIINGDGWKVRHIQDCSLPDRKRLKACLYIGDIKGKNNIIKVVREAIDEIRILYNPPQPGIKVKNGNIPADVVFLNVYYRYDRAKNRQLYTSNNNFVLVAEYCVPELTPINHGLPVGVLKSLITQKIGGILHSWNPVNYRKKGH